MKIAFCAPLLLAVIGAGCTQSPPANPAPSADTPQRADTKGSSQPSSVPNQLLEELASDDPAVRLKAIGTLISGTNRAENSARVKQAMLWLGSQPNDKGHPFVDVADEVAKRGYANEMMQLYVGPESLHKKSLPWITQEMTIILSNDDSNELLKMALEGLKDPVAKHRERVVMLLGVTLGEGSSFDKRRVGSALGEIADRKEGVDSQEAIQLLDMYGWGRETDENGKGQWLPRSQFRKSAEPLPTEELDQMKQQLCAPEDDLRSIAANKVNAWIDQLHFRGMIPLYCSMLSNRDRKVVQIGSRGLQQAALHGFGNDVVQAVLETAPQLDQEAIHRSPKTAIEVAADNGDTVRVIDLLFAALSSKDEKKRGLAASVIVKVTRMRNRAWLVRKLKLTLNSSDPVARREAAGILITLGETAATAELAQSAELGKRRDGDECLRSLENPPRLLIGLRFSADDEVAPFQHIAAIQGIYLGQDSASSLGQASGFMPSDAVTVVARQGYAIGALDVMANDRICGMRLIFMRIKDERRLDPHDSYESFWQGTRLGGAERRIGGDGAPIVGFLTWRPQWAKQPLHSLALLQSTATPASAPQ